MAGIAGMVPQHVGAGGIAGMAPQHIEVGRITHV